jgi:hypothetical protein
MCDAPGIECQRTAIARLAYDGDAEKNRVRRNMHSREIHLHAGHHLEKKPPLEATGKPARN